MKPSKIEKYELIDIVRAGIKKEKSSRVIASECNDELKRRGINDTVSHKAVNDYAKLLKESDRHVRKDVVQRNRSVQLKLIKTDIDIIETATRTTNALLDRFDYIDNLPDTVETLIDGLGQLGDDPDAWYGWKRGFMADMQRNVSGLATLNREVRENVKFLADLRMKAYEGNLVAEYIHYYTDIYRNMNPEAHEMAMQRIAQNPRLERIVEQQKELRGYEEG